MYVVEQKLKSGEWWCIGGTYRDRTDAFRAGLWLFGPGVRSWRVMRVAT